MDCRMDTDVGLSLQKLGSEGTLFGQGKTEGITIELNCPTDVVDEDRDAVEGRADDPGLHFTDSRRKCPRTIPSATTPAKRSSSTDASRRSTRRLATLSATGRSRCCSSRAIFRVLDFHPKSNRSPRSGISPTKV